MESMNCTYCKRVISAAQWKKHRAGAQHKRKVLSAVPPGPPSPPTVPHHQPRA